MEWNTVIWFISSLAIKKRGLRGHVVGEVDILLANLLATCILNEAYPPTQYYVFPYFTAGEKDNEIFQINTKSCSRINRVKCYGKVKVLLNSEVKDTECLNVCSARSH